MSERTLFALADFRGDGAGTGSGTWLDGHFAHLSASSLGMFRRCPRQFQQRYLLGRKEPPGEGLVLGSVFHETLNYNYGQKIVSREDRPLSELVEYLNDDAVPRVIETAGGMGEVRWDSEPTRALESVRSDTTRITSAYHRAVLPRMQPVAVEQRMEWRVEGVPVPILGYLDTILGDRAVDTKTGKQAVSKLKPSWRLQADLYSGYMGMPIEYHSMNRAATPKIVTGLESEDLVVRPRSSETENLLYVLRQMVEQIQWCYDRYGLEDKWPATGKWADWSQSVSPCAYCAYRKDPCPAWA